MFFQRVLFYPVHGKVSELRKVLADWAEANPMNLRINLSQKIYGEGAPLAYTLIHENLDDVEKHRDSGRVDEDFLAYRQKITELTSRGEDLELLHVLMHSGTAPTPAKFVLRLHFYPMPGKNGELMAALEEHVKAWESEGRSAYTIQRRILTPSETGTEFVGSYRYGSMTEYENDVINTPPSILNFSAKFSQILRAPVGHEFSQVVMPFSRQS